MAMLLRGAPVATALTEATAAESKKLRQNGVVPTLAIVRAGERADDLAYERGALKRAEAANVAIKRVLLPENVSQPELIETIERLNADNSVHGVLIFRPLPKQIDDAAVRAALLPEKDVDGITEGSLAGVFAGTGRGFPPCTAQACMEILRYYEIPLEGKRATVVGRSLVVGKPLAMMLLQKNATVTVCHTKTANLPEEAKRADVLVAAAGRAGVVGAAFVRAGQVVLDVGINFDAEGKMVGDADFAAVEPVVSAITPVPGGVGAVTSSILMHHTVLAATRMLERK